MIFRNYQFESGNTHEVNVQMTHLLRACFCKIETPFAENSC